jgi:sterol desaturase/sphingolipid hydroxylase (fatty acid hydroxylase superfamily)
MDKAAAYFVTKPGLILLFALVIFACERLFPAVRPLVKAHLVTTGGWLRRWGKNIALTAINAGLSPLLVIPLSAFAAQGAVPWRPVWLSGYWGLAFDLILLDLWIYWWHRANHQIAFLWRFHEIHHLDEFLDATTAVRFHFGEVALSALARSIAIYLFAAPLGSVVIFETLVRLSALFHHSNIRLMPSLERVLSRVVVTPSIHWVHHHAIRADTDSNYATVLSFWDRIFATRSPTRRSADMAIGVEHCHDRALAALLLRPFQPARRT